MSRLGKKPVAIPAGVNVAVSGRRITVSAGKNSLSMEHRPEVTVVWNQDEKSVGVSIDPARAVEPQVRAYWGMTRAMIQNMVLGVTKGYEKTLEVIGVGFTATVAGRSVDLKVGYANTIRVPIPEGIEVAIDKQFVKIKGADKQAVGQLAANIRAQRKPEPYNGKGIKYTTETIKRKQGKAFGA